jgi:hypothetical protein
MVYGDGWETAMVTGSITNFEEGSLPHYDRWVVIFDDDPNEYRFAWKVIKRFMLSDTADGELEFDQVEEFEVDERMRDDGEDIDIGDRIDEGEEVEGKSANPYHRMRRQRQAALGVGRVTGALLGHHSSVVDSDSDDTNGVEIKRDPMAKPPRKRQRAASVVAVAEDATFALPPPAASPRKKEDGQPMLMMITPNYDGPNLGLPNATSRWDESRALFYGIGSNRKMNAWMYPKIDSLAAMYPETAQIGLFGLQKGVRSLKVQKKAPNKIRSDIPWTTGELYLH